MDPTSFEFKLACFQNFARMAADQAEADMRTLRLKPGSSFHGAGGRRSTEHQQSPRSPSSETQAVEAA